MNTSEEVVENTKSTHSIPRAFIGVKVSRIHKRILDNRLKKVSMQESINEAYPGKTLKLRHLNTYLVSYFGLTAKNLKWRSPEQVSRINQDAYNNPIESTDCHVIGKPHGCKKSCEMTLSEMCEKISKVSNGSTEELADVLDVSKTTIYSWKHELAKISLDWNDFFTPEGRDAIKNGLYAKYTMRDLFRIQQQQGENDDPLTTLLKKKRCRQEMEELLKNDLPENDLPENDEKNPYPHLDAADNAFTDLPPIHSDNPDVFAEVDIYALPSDSRYSNNPCGFSYSQKSKKLKSTEPNDGNNDVNNTNFRLTYKTEL